MHILIISHSGCGKHELIEDILSQLNKPIWGYETVKEDSLAQDGLGSPIYIYEAGLPHVRTDENLAGYCLNHHARTFPEAFDRFAPKLRLPVPDGYLTLLNEIGTMESRSDNFCAAVMALLDGVSPVLAAVRDKDTAFLHAVRSHPNCKCFRLCTDNRAQITAEAVKYLQEAFQ